MLKRDAFFPDFAELEGSRGRGRGRGGGGARSR